MPTKQDIIDFLSHLPLEEIKDIVYAAIRQGTPSHEEVVDWKLTLLRFYGLDQNYVAERIRVLFRENHSLMPTEDAIQLSRTTPLTIGMLTTPSLEQAKRFLEGLAEYQVEPGTVRVVEPPNPFELGCEYSGPVVPVGVFEQQARYLFCVSWLHYAGIEEEYL